MKAWNICAAACVGIAAAGASGQTFYNVLGTPGSDSEATSVVRVRTGPAGYALASTAEAPGPGFRSDLVVTRTDDTGLVLWSVRLPVTDNSAFPRVVREAPNGDLVVACSVLSSPLSPGVQVLVARLNSFGSLLWMKRYEGEFAGETPAMEIARNGDILLAHSYYSPLNGAQMPQILRIDAAGGLIFNSTYPLPTDPNFTSARAVDLFEDDNGDLVLAGTMNWFDPFSGLSDSNVFTLRTDAGGSVVVGLEYASPFGQESFPYEEARAIERLRDGTIAISAVSDLARDFGGNQSPLHLRLQPGGAIISSSLLFDFSSNQGLYPAYQSLAEDPDGNLLLTGEINFGDGGSSARAWLITPDGDHIWHGEFYPPSDFGFNSRFGEGIPDIGPAGLKRYVFFGQIGGFDTPFGSNELILLRGDEFGQIGCTEQCIVPDAIPVQLGAAPLLFGRVFLDVTGEVDPSVSPGTPAFTVCGGKLCAADLDADGDVDLDDFFAFLGAFDSGEELADLNNSCTSDLDDFFLFLAEFDTGCN